MIEQIHLKNFKSSRDLTIPLASLSVLSGLNGSGKSSVLQAIALIRQSLALSEGYGKRHLHLRGPLIQLGTSSDVLSERADDDSISISFACNQQTHTWKASDIRAEDDDILLLDENQSVNTSVFEDTFLHTAFQFLQADRLTPEAQYDRSDSLNRATGFLGIHGEYTPAYLASQGERLLVSEGRQIHVAPLGVSETLFRQIVGTPRLNDQVAGWMQHFSPGINFKAERLTDTDLVALRYRYTSPVVAQSSNARRPSNVGYGLTYSLPIVVACLSAPIGSIILLENPEAHLHPRGQIALGKLIAQCAADGVQIVTETHSDHVLNGIRLAVKQSHIPADKVRICNFTRDIASGDTYIELPTILPNGELSAWPDGFFDEWEKSIEALLR
jgi:predicted ATPase